MAVVLSKIGIATPLGHSVSEFVHRVKSRSGALSNIPELELLEHPLGAKVQDISLKDIIKKRKEIKLYTRAASLGVLAAHRCLGVYQDPEVGLFVAVGREPPDEGSAESCLIASQASGRFQEVLLAEQGRALYPPLLPLRTLPNMILAHISIQFDIMGDNACWAGDEEMGIQAMQSGYWAIQEGRCTKALVGAADSFVSLGLARDLHRNKIVPPSEAGVFFLLEQKERPVTGDTVLSWSEQPQEDMRYPLETLLGYTGAAQRLLELVFLNHENEFITWGGISMRKQLL